MPLYFLLTVCLLVVKEAAVGSPWRACWRSVPRQGKVGHQRIPRRNSCVLLSCRCWALLCCGEVQSVEGLLTDVSAMLLDCYEVRRLPSVASIRCCPPGCRTPLAGTCRDPLLLLQHVRMLLRCLLWCRSIRCWKQVWGVFSTHRKLVLTRKCHPSHVWSLWILLRQFLLGPCCPCRVGPSVTGWCSCVVLESVCWCQPPCKLVVVS